MKKAIGGSFACTTQETAEDENDDDDEEDWDTP
jgi:hypothetical protein